MFYVASKVFWLLAQPLSIILLLIVAAFILILLHRRRLALSALALAGLVLGICAYTSVGYVLIQPLEDRFAIPQAPSTTVEAIVMLGGATKARPSTARQTVALNDAGERLTTTLWLAQQYPEASIVLTGGGALLSADSESEAVTARRFLVAMGSMKTGWSWRETRAIRSRTRGSRATLWPKVRGRSYS